MHTTFLVKYILSVAVLSFLEVAAFGQNSISSESMKGTLPQTEANALMDSAIEDLKRERGQDAVPKLVRYLHFYPNNASAHQCLGIGYDMVGNPAAAEREYKIAIETGQPANVGMSMYNLANLYEGQGDLRRAADTLQRLLKEGPKDIDKATIEARLKRIESESAKANEMRQKGQLLDSDYYNEACASFPTKWSEKSMPLLVFIEPQPEVPDEYFKTLKDSFNEWETSSAGTVKFKFADNKEQANIRCKWTNRAEDFEDSGESGLTKTYRAFDDLLTIERADIALRYKNVHTGDLQTSRKIHLICQHEIGHALGIAGHSHNPKDVMFMAARFSSIEPKLTDRDITTLKKLYEKKFQFALPPALLNTNLLPWAGSIVLFLLVVLSPHKQTILKSFKGMFSRRKKKDYFDFTPPKRR